MTSAWWRCRSSGVVPTRRPRRRRWSSMASCTAKNPMPIAQKIVVTMSRLEKGRGAGHRPTAGNEGSAAEREVDGRGPALVDLDLAVLLAELLVPRFDRVLAQRHIGVRDGPGGTADREV